MVIIQDGVKEEVVVTKDIELVVGVKDMVLKKVDMVDGVNLYMIKAGEKHIQDGKLVDLDGITMVMIMIMIIMVDGIIEDGKIITDGGMMIIMTMIMDMVAGGMMIIIEIMAGGMQMIITMVNGGTKRILCKFLLTFISMPFFRI